MARASPIRHPVAAWNRQGPLSSVNSSAIVSNVSASSGVQASADGWPPDPVASHGGSSGDLGQLRQRVSGQVRPADLVQGLEGGQDAPPQENAGVDARILAAAVCALVSHESADVLFLQAPQINRAQTLSEALRELPIPCGCGDGDGVALAAREVPDCTIEWQRLPGFVPRKESIAGFGRRALDLIELPREPLGLAPSSLAFADRPKVLLPALHSENAPEVASRCFFLYSVYLMSDI